VEFLETKFAFFLVKSVMSDNHLTAAGGGFFPAAEIMTGPPLLFILYGGSTVYDLLLIANETLKVFRH
jgi:hypothetical protein